MSKSYYKKPVLGPDSEYDGFKQLKKEKRSSRNSSLQLVDKSDIKTIPLNFSISTQNDHEYEDPENDVIDSILFSK